MYLTLISWSCFIKNANKALKKWRKNIFEHFIMQTQQKRSFLQSKVLIFNSWLIFHSLLRPFYYTQCSNAASRTFCIAQMQTGHSDYVYFWNEAKRIDRIEPERRRKWRISQWLCVCVWWERMKCHRQRGK